MVIAHCSPSGEFSPPFHGLQLSLRKWFLSEIEIVISHYLEAFQRTNLQISSGLALTLPPSCVYGEALRSLLDFRVREKGKLDVPTVSTQVSCSQFRSI